MISRSVVLPLILLVAVPIAGCQKADAPPAEAIANRPPAPPITSADSAQRAEEVTGLAAKHLEAMHAGNLPALDSLTSSDVVHVSDAGELTVAEENFLAKHKNGTPTHYQIDQSTARVFEGDVVVVNAQLSEVGGKKKAHLTQVWVLRYDDVVSKTTSTAALPHAIKLVSNPRAPIIPAMCCAMARWELTSSHASSASSASSASIGSADLPQE